MSISIESFEMRRNFLEKAQYIINNPFKVWPEVEEYPWVGGTLVEVAGRDARPTTEARPTSEIL